MAKSLNVATPEDQPVDAIMTQAFSFGWNMDVTQQFVVWAAFLLVLTHFQFQTVLSSSLLGFAVTVKQLLVQNMCLSSPQGWEHHLDFGIGPTHVHTSTVLGYAVVLSHLGFWTPSAVVLPEVPHHGRL